MARQAPVMNPTTHVHRRNPVRLPCPLALPGCAAPCPCGPCASACREHGCHTPAASRRGPQQRPPARAFPVPPRVLHGARKDAWHGHQPAVRSRHGAFQPQQPPDMMPPPLCLRARAEKTTQQQSFLAHIPPRAERMRAHAPLKEPCSARWTHPVEFHDPPWHQTAARARATKFWRPFCGCALMCGIFPCGAGAPPRRWRACAPWRTYPRTRRSYATAHVLARSGCNGSVAHAIAHQPHGLPRRHLISPRKKSLRLGQRQNGARALA